jgi:hypothetical protein
MLFRNLTTATALLVVIGASQSKAQQDDPKAAQGMEALWNDLAGTEDESRASRALLAFAAKPKETTALFKELLKPVKVDPDRIKKLVAQLDDARFARREAAVKELEYLGKFARPVLEECLKGEVSLEVKKRIGKLLEQLPPEVKEPAPMPMPMPMRGGFGRGISVTTVGGKTMITVDGQTYDLDNLTKPAPVIIAPRMNTQWLRAVRAVVILEGFGTPEARAILETMASGEKDAPPTQEAKAALERLAKSK